jgi:hypothetical protein
MEEEGRNKIVRGTTDDIRKPERRTQKALRRI